MRFESERLLSDSLSVLMCCAAQPKLLPHKPKLPPLSPTRAAQLLEIAATTQDLYCLTPGVSSNPEPSSHGPEEKKE